MNKWIRSAVTWVTLVSLAVVTARVDGVDGNGGLYLSMAYGSCASYITIWYWFVQTIREQSE